MRGRTGRTHAHFLLSPLGRSSRVGVAELVVVDLGDRSIPDRLVDAIRRRIGAIVEAKVVLNAAKQRERELEQAAQLPPEVAAAQAELAAPRGA